MKAGHDELSKKTEDKWDFTVRFHVYLAKSLAVFTVDLCVRGSNFL